MVSGPSGGDSSAGRGGHQSGDLHRIDPAYSTTQELDALLVPVQRFLRLELPYAAAAPAARAYAAYRKAGGVKTAPLPDFFIGGHAEAAGLILLTRDAVRYRTYFPSVQLICP